MSANGNSTKRPRNLAARMGRWSASHWKTATFGWLALVVVSVFVSIQIGTNQIKQTDANVGESRTADKIISDAGFAVDGFDQPVRRAAYQLTHDFPVVLVVLDVKNCLRAHVLIAFRPQRNRKEESAALADFAFDPNATLAS